MFKTWDIKSIRKIQHFKTRSVQDLFVCLGLLHGSIPNHWYTLSKTKKLSSERSEEGLAYMMIANIQE